MANIYLNHKESISLNLTFVRIQMITFPGIFKHIFSDRDLLQNKFTSLLTCLCEL